MPERNDRLCHVGSVTRKGGRLAPRGGPPAGVGARNRRSGGTMGNEYAGASRLTDRPRPAGWARAGTSAVGADGEDAPRLRCRRDARGTRRPAPERSAGGMSGEGGGG